MFEKLIQSSALISGYVALILAICFSVHVTAQNISSNETEKSAFVELIPLSGQITKQVIDMPTESVVGVLNKNLTPADVDLIAYDLEGKETARETIRVEPGKKISISLSIVFPKLVFEALSQVEIQTSVLSPNSDPNTFRAGPGSENALQLPVGFFSQNQSPWNTYQLGTCTGETIDSAGCAITSIAMAMTSTVSNLDPGVLNTYLKNNNGYASGCLVKWDSADEIDGSGGFQYYGSSTVGSAANLKSLIDSGKFSVVKSTRFTNHFGVIVGYTNSGTSLSNFYYLDPEDNTATFHYVGDGWVGSSSVIHRYK